MKQTARIANTVTTKILVYPLDKNPYQRLLYSALDKARPERYEVRMIRRIRYVEPIHFALAIFRWRLAGYKTIHIHWQDFRPSYRKQAGLRISLIASLLALKWIESLQFRVIWTAHNVVPHERQTSDDQRVTKALSELADAVVVHNSEAVRSLDHLDANISRASVIPHGSYLGHYGEMPGRFDARIKLKVPATAVLAVAIGQIRPYKGLDRLAVAFADEWQQGEILLIAGEVGDDALARRLEGIAETCKGIRLDFGYISDADLLLYLGAGDVACFAFDDLSTSGSVILALDHGLPIMAPRLPGLGEIPGDVGWWFPPRQEAVGWTLFRTSSVAERQLRGARASAWSQRHDWAASAELTAALIDVVNK